MNLLGLSQASLSRFFEDQGEKPFRAQQLMKWVHQAGEVDVTAMTDLSRALRDKLAACAEITAPAVVSDRLSADGTRKWLMDTGAGNAVETVFIPEEGRGTLCVSSQVGCALECAFCATGRQGFNRNLASHEIVGQLWWANRALRGADFGARPVTNVVMMGMGEPLANFDNVVEALSLMLDDNAYGLSRRRVTVSTSGLVPAMDRLAQVMPVALAVSLHAPDDALRDRLVPINRKYPVAELLAACRRYLEHAPRDFVTFEYVLLDGVNDNQAHARKLIALTRDLPCKFNLIPFNPFPDSGFSRSSDARVRHFQAILMDAGIVTTVRKTRGDEIDAACGQLAGRVVDRSQRVLKRAAS